jgi:hypothetical protein
MNVLKTNIRFDYLYRDAGNYKNYGFVIFSNPNNLSIEKLRSSIISNLNDGEFFNHKRLKIPALFFSIKNSDDHFWHEFENIEETNETPTETRTIDEFLNSFSYSSNTAI